VTRVLLADDQAEVRTGLRLILQRHADLDVVGDAVDGADAIGLARRRRPDVVLMDVRMPRLDGLAATRELTAAPGGPAVVVLTTFDLDEYVFGALRAGAAGFLLKDAPPQRIVEAVRAAAAGAGLIAPEVTRRLVARFAQLSPARPDDERLAALTPRERDVLLLVARGRSNAEVAADLVVEETTVKSHVARVLGKLGLRSRAQAVVFAYETGLVSPGDPARA
jgi:DNA-binding NarL/FixJ family response regulator